MNKNADFIVSNTEGSVWTFKPISENAKTFTNEDLGIEGWQWLGDFFGIDANLANNLVSDLEIEGFVLELV